MASISIAILDEDAFDTRLRVSQGRKGWDRTFYITQPVQLKRGRGQ